MSTISLSTPARFLTLCSSLGVPPPLALRTSNMLQSAYAEPHRHYHTLQHVNAMLQGLDARFESLELDKGEEQAVKLAVWFHDCVYDPRRGGGWNETESAGRWETFVQDAIGVLNHLLHPVSALILATISHQPLPPSPTTPLSPRAIHLFLNLDLFILASPPAAYAEYALAIRAEYEHVPEHEYKVGRTKVLGVFLEREQLYFGSGWEEEERVARENMRREIDGLGEGSDAH